jgi:hypothetical protein
MYSSKGINQVNIKMENWFWAVILKLQIPNLWLRIITSRLLICETILTSTFLLDGARVSDLFFITYF